MSMRDIRILGVGREQRGKSARAGSGWCSSRRERILGRRGASWLAELLPAIRRFLETHADHEIRFGDSEELDIPCSDDPASLDWVMEAGFVLVELPRYYAERLGVRTWDEVVARLEGAPRQPYWWTDEELRRAARKTFERLTAQSAPPSSGDAV